MKRLILLFLCSSLVFSCRKEKSPDPEPEPAPVRTGTVNITVLSFDSLGEEEVNRSGFEVSLYKTNYSVLTDASGIVSIGNVAYGDVLPVIKKNYYDGAPVRLSLNSGQVTATIPCPKFCAYRLQNLSAFVVSPDSIPVSFNLDRPIPAGKTCKLAVMFSPIAINSAEPGVIDTLRIGSQVIQKLNVAQLPNFKAALAALDKNKSFHISVVPVSYGPYYSNVFGKQMLLGENPYFPNDIIFNKNW